MFSNKNHEVHYAWFIYQWNIRQPLKMMITKRDQLERMFPIVSREKWVFPMNTHTMTLSTKISLHVDKDSKSKQEGKQLLCEQFLRQCRGHLFVCLASSHSPFFWNILLILLWGTTLPMAWQCDSDESKSTPYLRQGLTSHSILSLKT